MFDQNKLRTCGVELILFPTYDDCAVDVNKFLAEIKFTYFSLHTKCSELLCNISTARYFLCKCRLSNCFGGLWNLTYFLQQSSYYCYHINLFCLFLYKHERVWNINNDIMIYTCLTEHTRNRAAYKASTCFEKITLKFFFNRSGEWKYFLCLRDFSPILYN